MVVPLMVAASSPYLASRSFPYIIAGFSGIICLSMFLVQPLLAAGYLPGLPRTRSRKWHRIIGAVIIICVVLHVGGLYVTSPPDTIDALLLISPTPFSLFGVAAMWGVFLTAGFAFWRSRFGMRYSTWSRIHRLSVPIIVLSTVFHALQIDGTMGTKSKWALCIAALMTMALALIDARRLKQVFNKRDD